MGSWIPATLMLSNEHRELLSSLPFPERRRWTLTILGIEGIVTWDPGRADWPMPADAVLDTLEQIDNLPVASGNCES